MLLRLSTILNAALLLALLLPISPAFALTVESSAVSEALDQADLVGVVEIESVANTPDAIYYATRTVTARLLSVERFPKQRTTTSSEIAIRVVGGESDGIGVIYTGYPRLYRGQRYRVHLKQQADGIYTIAGWDSGVEPLSATRTYTRNRVDGSDGDGTGAFLFWDDRMMPIPYYISASSFSGHPDYVRAIDLSFQEWSRRQDNKVDFLPMGCTTKTKNENDGINSIILMTDSWPFDASAIAITRNFYVAGDGPSAGMILDSDILLNGINHSFTTTNQTGKHDVQNIVTHEIGHFIGLGHEANPVDSDATMYAQASPNETKKRTLASSDLAGLYAAYAGVPFSKQTTSEAPSCYINDNAGVSCLSVHRSQSAPTNAAGWIVVFVLWWGLTFLARLILNVASPASPSKQKSS